MRVRSLVAAAVVASNVVAWWALDRVAAPTDDLGALDCVSYRSRDDRSHFTGDAHVVAPETIEVELALASRWASCVRVYHTSQGMQRVPEIAARHGLEVMLGVWVSDDAEATRRELEAAITLANTHDNVRALVVGNETLQYARVPFETLAGLIREAAARTDRVVTSAENWFVWLGEPRLAEAVDVMMVHALPYWDSAPAESAVGLVGRNIGWVHAKYPGKEVLIGETGWPTSGPVHGPSRPSPADQAIFVRALVAWAEAEGVRYNVLELFDQPWKIESIEGRVGAHWGLLEHDGTPKLVLGGADLEREWGWAAAVSALVALALMLWFFRREPRLKPRGDVLAALVIQALIAIAVLVWLTAEREYLLSRWMMWTLVFPTVALILVVTGALLVEAAEVVGDAPLPVTEAALAPRPLAHAPFVSIHVPCRNEPPELVIATLESLLALDYPAYEVRVVDNNSRDASVWRPVEAFAARFPDKLRFHVLEDWPGFKAGALNFALSVTPPEAEIIAVVDSDYRVDAGWLRACVPLFEDARVAVVQAPQDHREETGSAWERMAADEQAGFFRVGMIQRNEKNAIIQHGTMTLIRRRALEEVGRWALWCIVEDAELGLRLQAAGHRAVYVAKSFGKGLVPPTFSAACTQRFRWAYGAVRVTLAHWRLLLGRRPGLTRAQRFRYLAGWLPWFADAFHLLFSLLGLVMSVWFLLDFRSFPPPELALPFIAFSVLRWGFSLVTYRRRVAVGLVRTAGAALVGLAFTHTIGGAIVRGLLGAKLPFRRTEKSGAKASWWRALGRVPLDMLLAVLLAGMGFALVKRYGMSRDALVWCSVLWLQALPGAAALAVALISARRAPVVDAKNAPRRDKAIAP